MSVEPHPRRALAQQDLDRMLQELHRRRERDHYVAYLERRLRETAGDPPAGAESWEQYVQRMLDGLLDGVTW